LNLGRTLAVTQRFVEAAAAFDDLIARFRDAPEPALPAAGLDGARQQGARAFSIEAIR
jgi:hypothetical protein